MSKHPEHKMHAHSLEAYDPALLSERRQMILACITASSVPLTVREIAGRLGFGENMNAVAPEITNMVEEHILVECPKVKCATTGKSVRTLGLAVPLQQRLLA